MNLLWTSRGKKYRIIDRKKDVREMNERRGVSLGGMDVYILPHT